MIGIAQRTKLSENGTTGYDRRSAREIKHWTVLQEATCQTAQLGQRSRKKKLGTRRSQLEWRD